ncbi:hypothetical protein WICPIJ_001744 [Wickerhamomyces pijperi]|uniref:C3HC-type domain-containing protein n=1 Tax=Wickerhamomyces pijperi TaxID=599730 RepID=A0A9P8QCZ1_WICPI|nr:hypothetical protein WICPIJ_001744 [Wickerhamomyces pijperi]
MDSSILSSILSSLSPLTGSDANNTSAAQNGNIKLNTLNKKHSTPSKVIKPLSKNPTIRYFQSISQYRIRSTPAAITASDTATNHTICPDLSLPPQQTFTPYSTSNLLKRIQTYIQPFTPFPLTWQLSKLSPLTLSLNGWICSSHTKNEILCVSCSARLMLIIPEPTTQYLTEEEEQDQMLLMEAIEGKYKELSLESHESHCPWRCLMEKGGVSRELVYDVRLEDVKENLSMFKELYLHNLRTLAANQEIESLKDEETLKDIKAWISAQMIPFHDSIALLALNNWKLSPLTPGSVSQARMLSSCDSCNRRFLLSLNDKDCIQASSLQDEHHNWCRFNQKGVDVLLKTFKIIDIECKYGEKPQEDENEEETDTNTVVNVKTDQEVYDLKLKLYDVEDKTKERLDKLRQVYFLS